MSEEKKKMRATSAAPGGSAGGLYCLGMIGAAVFYVQNASSFWWDGVIGLLKALVWPAYLIYDALKYMAG